MEAQAKLQTARLEAIQQKERVIDKKRKAALENEIKKRKADLENEIKKREAFRNIALAEVECQVWKRNSIVTEPHMDSNLYQGVRRYLLRMTLRHPLRLYLITTQLLHTCYFLQLIVNLTFLMNAQILHLFKNNSTALVKTNQPLQQTCTKALLVDSNFDNLVHQRHGLVVKSVRLGSW